MLINRQVDVILQNNTLELLTIESSQIMSGAWALSGAPKLGNVITKQGSGKWSAIAYNNVFTVGAFIHLGSTKGYIGMEWWLREDASDFRIDVDVPPGLHHTIKEVELDADYRICLVTLLPGVCARP